MPIFDDPKKSLERIQRQLLQEEEEEYEEYEEYDEEFLTEEDWLEAELAEARAMLEEEAEEEEEEPAYRNFANGYGQQPRRQIYDFEEEYDETEEEPEQTPARGAKGQLVLTFVLLAGILAVAAYWVAVLL